MSKKRTGKFDAFPESPFRYLERDAVEGWFASRVDLASKMVADALLLGLSFAGAFLIRFDGHVPPQMWEICRHILPWVVLGKVAVYRMAGLYRSFWRYSGVRDLQRLLVTQVTGLGTCLFVVTMAGSYRLPWGIYAIDTFLALILTGGVRFGPRWVREVVPSSWLRPLRRALPGWVRSRSLDVKRVLIVGAGDEGERIVSELSKSSSGKYLAVGIVDDDPLKRGRHIHGVPVLGTNDDIPRLAENLEVEEIIISRPSHGGEEVRSVLAKSRGVKARLRIVPTLAEIVSGSARPTDIRDLKLKDLLRREEAKLDIEQISGYLRGKRILVTGAGGSIGSELCRQILPFRPAELLLFGRGENSIFSIDQELAVSLPPVRRRCIIGDVINKKKLEGVFAAFRPEIVFHAGADKHVPLMEANPDEAVLNNIFGTRNVLEVSEAFGVERLVCISTDKAVNPTSVMGSCKKVAELVLQSRPWNTPSMVVRFGNVLGSRGSVVPTFYEQIRRGGPVTVTHPEMTRYFMTIPEAAKLVIQAGALGRGGEIFVLDMGEQVRIADLAREMIQISGLDPDEVPIQFVGIRPGEKLYEELMEHGEELRATSHPKILQVARCAEVPADLGLRLRDLYEAAIEMDQDRIVTTLSRILTTYRPSPKHGVGYKPARSAVREIRLVASQGHASSFRSAD